MKTKQPAKVMQALRHRLRIHGLCMLSVALLGAGCEPGLAPPSGASGSPGTPTLPAPPNSSSAASASPAAARSPVVTTEPTITIHHGEKDRSLSRTDLLSHPAVETLTIIDQAAYRGKSLTFQAVPMTALFEGIELKPGETLEFDTLDGFSASLDPIQVLNSKPEGAIAYLAVEQSGKPWPKLGAGSNTAGPLYLVWKNPELSKIGQEQWPYQLRSFTIKDSLEKRFPSIQPATNVRVGDPVRLGYAAFVKNCFACHTLNGEGNGRLGPDLNIPHNPTEYLRENYLRKLVRNPQDLRHWKGSKMSAFPQSSLPEADLDHIIAYLKHKADQRRTLGQSPPSP